jgi:hypothetical protein
MNPHTLTDLASYRTHEIRSQVADCRRSGRLSQTRATAAGRAGRPSRLRSRIGFTLVEAGLRPAAAAELA